MTSMIEADELLKQDVLGRVRVPVERREAILAEFEKSGSSAAEFARLTGIKYQTFCCWVQKHRRKPRAGSSRACGAIEDKSPGASGATVQFIEAFVEGDRTETRSSGGLVVELPGGSRMKIESPVQTEVAAELVVLIAQRSQARC